MKDIAMIGFALLSMLFGKKSSAAVTSSAVKTSKTDQTEYENYSKLGSGPAYDQNLPVTASNTVIVSQGKYTPTAKPAVYTRPVDSTPQPQQKADSTETASSTGQPNPRPQATNKAVVYNPSPGVYEFYQNGAFVSRGTITDVDVVIDGGGAWLTGQPAHFYKEGHGAESTSQYYYYKSWYENLYRQYPG